MTDNLISSIYKALDEERQRERLIEDQVKAKQAIESAAKLKSICSIFEAMQNPTFIGKAIKLAIAIWENSEWRRPFISALWGFIFGILSVFITYHFLSK